MSLWHVYCKKIGMKRIINYVPYQPFFEIQTNDYVSKFSTVAGEFAQYYTFRTSSNTKDVVIAVPDGAVDILFHTSGNKVDAQIYGSVKKGTYVHFETDSNYFGVRFSPGTAENLLKCPIDKFTGVSVNFGDVLKKSTKLIENICFGNSFENKAKEFESFYLSNREDSKMSPLVSFVIKKINRTYGEIRVQDLADEAGYSTRHINNQFKKHVGLAPKMYIRIVRFQRSFELIRSQKNTDFAELAEDVGYYDQAHFINEFKEFSLKTPSQIIN